MAPLDMSNLEKKNSQWGRTRKELLNETSVTSNGVISLCVGGHICAETQFFAHGTRDEEREGRISATLRWTS